MQHRSAPPCHVACSQGCRHSSHAACHVARRADLPLLRQIPYFNAPIFLENKTQIGKVEEILGSVNNVVRPHA